MNVYHPFKKLGQLESDVIKRIMRSDPELIYSEALDTVDYKVLCDCIDVLEGFVFLRTIIRMGENPPILCLPTSNYYGVLFYYQEPKKSEILIAGGIGGGEGEYKTYWKNEEVITKLDLPHYLY
jgi:hypothetical protein